jgi:hypothetical protein
MKVTLTPPQYEQAGELVQQGRTPTAAVSAVARASASPVTPAALSAAEQNAYHELRQRGKSDAEARDAIQVMREFMRRFGTPPREEPE